MISVAMRTMVRIRHSFVTFTTTLKSKASAVGDVNDPLISA